MNNNFLCVDFNINASCSMQCRYCYEGNATHEANRKPTDEIVSCFYDRMDDLLTSYIPNNFSGISIGLWGGEPTLNYNLVNSIIDKYSNNDKIKFLLYTNGYNLSNVIDTLKKFKDITVQGYPKIYTQVSFDGTKMQDINRLLPYGNKTGERVKNNILLLGSEKIPYTIKSTVTNDTFKYLPDSYSEILEIYNNFKNTNNVINRAYFPTIDYSDSLSYDTDYKEDLRNALTKIAVMDMQFYKENNYFFFRLFENNKAICSAGANMLAIDVDGNLYPCHGCFYQNPEMHSILNIRNGHNFINIIRDKFSYFNKFYRNQPLKCRTCEATFCLRCNVSKFARSKKDAYDDKWTDHDNQPHLCEYYIIVSEVRHAIERILNGKGRRMYKN